MRGCGTGRMTGLECRTSSRSVLRVADRYFLYRQAVSLKNSIPLSVKRRSPAAGVRYRSARSGGPMRYGVAWLRCLRGTPQTNPERRTQRAVCFRTKESLNAVNKGRRTVHEPPWELLRALPGIRVACGRTAAVPCLLLLSSAQTRVFRACCCARADLQISQLPPYCSEMRLT